MDGAKTQVRSLTSQCSEYCFYRIGYTLKFLLPLMKTQVGCYNSSPAARIVLRRHGSFASTPIQRDHVLHTLGVQVIQLHSITLCQIAQLQIYDVDLAIPIWTSAATIIRTIEEDPEPLPVERESVRFVADDAESPLHVALCDICFVAAGEVWIFPSRVRGPGCWSARGGLPVWRFDLHEGREDVLGVVELVGVEGVVFGAGTDEPGSLRGLTEETAAGADLLIVCAVEVVVCGPEPGVFDVRGGSVAEVHEHEGGRARL